MIIQKIYSKFLLLIAVMIFMNLMFVSAWDFNGTIKNINGTALYNATINITIRDDTFGIIGYNYTRSNETGEFYLNVTGNPSWMYQPVITHFIDNKTDGTTALDYVGQSLPAFPYREFQNGMNTNFYLREAGTINITAINGTGSPENFQYQIKDTALGYPIAESWNYVSSATIYVPRDRNYSIMIYPNASLPVSFDWNNFSSDSDYNFNYNSKYNKTTHKLDKQFNISETLEWVSGYINVTGIDGWDEFQIIPYILEPGNMIYFGENAGMPYNMSAWRMDGSSDAYNLTSGFYNITIPAPAEITNYMLFAMARNGTEYYGQYLNVSLTYGSGLAQTNFTFMSGLLNYTGWGSSNGNISMNDATNWQNINISSTKQGFNLINSTGNNTLNQLSAHIEVIVDYSNYGSKEFTFMLDTPRQGAASFYIPMINATGFKEINIYSQNYAPKRVGEMTVSQIIANPNITLETFNPGDIDGRNISNNVYISLYKSNSTCDVPNPPLSCSLAESSNMDNFNPLNAIIGGGKVSFRMGLTSSGIEVHYVNVDMLASGPPSALFDDSTDESTSSGFDSAMRFGSSGPKIYDYVLISMPYTEGSSSQTGLNENADINMSIPLLYDDNWNIIWNASINGTNGTLLANNYSHYSDEPSEWETLMNQNNCTSNVSKFNATNPCYIDKTNNKIWVRLPHFSGTSPSISGSVISATTTTTDTTTASSSSSSGSGYPNYRPSKNELEEGYQKVIRKNWKISFKLGKDSHTFKLENITKTTAKVSVSSETQEATLSIGEEKKFDISGDNYYDILVKLNSIDSNYISSQYFKSNFTIQTIHEEIVSQQQENQAGEETIQKTSENQAGEEKANLTWLWVLIAMIIILILSGIGYKKSRK